MHANPIIFTFTRVMYLRKTKGPCIHKCQRESNLRCKCVNFYIAANQLSKEQLIKNSILIETIYLQHVISCA